MSKARFKARAQSFSDSEPSVATGHAGKKRTLPSSSMPFRKRPVSTAAAPLSTPTSTVSVSASAFSDAMGKHAAPPSPPSPAQGKRIAPFLQAQAGIARTANEQVRHARQEQLKEQLRLWMISLVHARGCQDGVGCEAVPGCANLANLVYHTESCVAQEQEEICSRRCCKSVRQLILHYDTCALRCVLCIDVNEQVLRLEVRTRGACGR